MRRLPILNLTLGKTAVAKQIKTTLGLVEAFTASHFDKVIAAVTALDNQQHVLTDEQLSNDLSLASSSEKDRLPLIPEISFSSEALKQPLFSREHGHL